MLLFVNFNGKIILNLYVRLLEFNDKKKYNINVGCIINYCIMYLK